MSMSRKDYRKFAKIVQVSMEKDHYEPNPPLSVEQAEWVAFSMAQYFSEDNPRFRKQDFFEACGLDRLAQKHAYR